MGGASKGGLVGGSDEMDPKVAAHIGLDTESSRAFRAYKWFFARVRIGMDSQG